MAKKNNKILVTGAAGFIGFHLCRRLLEGGAAVVGCDNISDYYDVHLKLERLKQIEKSKPFHFVKMDIAEKSTIAELFSKEKFDIVVNLAAQVSVRYSVTNPHAYIDSNIVGFLNILEGCRNNAVKHLIFASSSSVYGANTRMPYSVNHNVDHPISLYAATKKADELMAHAYASLYSLPCTGLRFFTVYGPWGRPDMSYFIFTKAILEGAPIDVYNYGKMQRDFTYVDDIVEGIAKVMDKASASNPDWRGDAPDPATSLAPYRIYNIGNNNPIEIEMMIDLLEKHLGKKAIKKYLPLQQGDVLSTFADIDALVKDVGFKPATSIEDGLGKFVKWYREYYGV